MVSVAELGLVKQPFLAFTALSLVRKSERTTTTTITIPFHGFFYRLFFIAHNGFAIVELCILGYIRFPFKNKFGFCNGKESAKQVSLVA